jgi:hypothetical protein
MSRANVLNVLWKYLSRPDDFDVFKANEQELLDLLETSAMRTGHSKTLLFRYLSGSKRDWNSLIESLTWANFVAWMMRC